MWLFANWPFTCSLLYKVLFTRSVIPNFWCRGFTFGSLSFYWFSGAKFLIYSSARLSLRVLVWFLVMDTLSSTFFVRSMFLGFLVFNSAILSSNSHLFVWFFIVCLSLVSLIYLFSSLPTSKLALFFVIAIISSLLFLTSALRIGGAPIIALLALFLKLGLPPFHFWSFVLLPSLSNFSLFVFLSGIKVGPLWFLILEIPASLPLFFFSALLGFVTLMVSSGLGTLLLSSSFLQPILLSQLAPHGLVSFSSVYFFCVACRVLSSYLKISPLLGLWMLMGVPPLGIFFIKVYFLTTASMVSCFLLLLISAMVTVPYISFSFSLVFVGSSSPSSFFGLNLFCLLPLLL